ncbi:MAG TPA: SRPBCC family protein [Acidobacteriaceae bacterium]|nr:SRPBCC family protein [Acidobacteriaceae bacterium]
MRTLGRILLSLIVLIAVVIAIAYVDGLTLPVNHVTTVSGTVAAPPDKVFALIANVSNAPTWRHAVQSVTVLPPDAGRDHWTENLAHGQTMTFLATHSEAPTRRDVLLDLPTPSYGGTWTYLLSPGPTPNTTNLTITETGFIRPPLYRFMMYHVFGITSNLDQYLADARADAPNL